jgi:transcriptional regulator with XRE-family HTH domain
MLEDFADELKNARLKKGISLEEMAARTRIDIKFLEAIDNGNFGFLPELYVKAFIKDYAKVIDLDEEEVIRKYIDAKVGKHSEKDSSEKSKNSLRTLIYVSGIVIIGIIVFIAFFNKSSKVIVEEKPYEKVLEESENRYTVKEKKEESINQASVSDSLVLQIANIDPVDSAWVMIIYDDNKKEDFLLYPQRTKTVKALDNFKFTLGNSGVISLVLNNHKLNFAGVKGAVRHYIVSGDTIERLSSPPVLHSN